jgi:hypothetical protein
MTTNRQSPPERFGLVGAYDGDAVGLGRVIVDSTWHHWFSYNIVGLRDLAPGYFSQMQDYYRNVALWLATPAQRTRMLSFATWGVVSGSAPGMFDRQLGIWGIGERAVDAIGRAAPQCVRSELVAAAIGIQREELQRSGHLDLIEQAVIGGLGEALIDTARGLRHDEAFERPSELESSSILEQSRDGLALAKRALKEALEERIDVLHDLHQRTGEDEGARLKYADGAQVASWETDLA